MEEIKADAPAQRKGHPRHGVTLNAPSIRTGDVQSLEALQDDGAQRISAKATDGPPRQEGKPHLWSATKVVLDHLAFAQTFELRLALDGRPVHKYVDLADLIRIVIPDEAEACACCSERKSGKLLRCLARDPPERRSRSLTLGAVEELYHAGASRPHGRDCRIWIALLRSGDGGLCR